MLLIEPRKYILKNSFVSPRRQHGNIGCNYWSLYVNTWHTLRLVNSKKHFSCRVKTSKTDLFTYFITNFFFLNSSLNRIFYLSAELYLFASILIDFKNIYIE